MSGEGLNKNYVSLSSKGDLPAIVEEIASAGGCPDLSGQKGFIF